MKHLITILAAVLCAVCLSGCEKRNIKEAETLRYGNRLITAEYHGHRYIIYKGIERGGITHDPDCPCHKNNPELLKKK